MRKAKIFFPALYSWDEFWGTISAGWSLFGDPRKFTDQEFKEWLGEEKVGPIYQDFVILSLNPPLVIPSPFTEENFMPYYILRDHAYRVMDWLGFAEGSYLVDWLISEDQDYLVVMPQGSIWDRVSTMNKEEKEASEGQILGCPHLWWLFGFVGGDVGRLSEFTGFVGFIDPPSVYQVIETLKPFANMVQEISKRKGLMRAKDIKHFSPPPDYDILGQRTPHWKLQRKYPLFEPYLVISPGDKMLEAPDFFNHFPFLKAKLLSIYWYYAKEERKPSEAKAVEELKRLRQLSQQHPMCKLIHYSKFAPNSLTEREGKVRDINRLVQQCLEEKLNVEEILKEALETDLNLQMELETAQRSGNICRIDGKRKQVGDKVYRRIDAWFRRRGVSMPKPEAGWRDRIMKIPR